MRIKTDTLNQPDLATDRLDSTWNLREATNDSLTQHAYPAGYIAALADHIADGGTIEPITVVDHFADGLSDKEYIVVNGGARLEATVLAKAKTITADILTRADCEPWTREQIIQLVAEANHDNSAPLTMAEKKEKFSAMLATVSPLTVTVTDGARSKKGKKSLAYATAKSFPDGTAFSASALASITGLSSQTAYNYLAQTAEALQAISDLDETDRTPEMKKAVKRAEATETAAERREITKAVKQAIRDAAELALVTDEAKGTTRVKTDVDLAELDDAQAEAIRIAEKHQFNHIMLASIAAHLTEITRRAKATHETKAKADAATRAKAERIAKAKADTEAEEARKAEAEAEADAKAKPAVKKAAKAEKKAARTRKPRQTAATV